MENVWKMKHPAARAKTVETITGRERGFPGQLISIEKRPSSEGIRALAFSYLLGRSALDALGTDVGLFRFAVYLDTDLLKIRQPAAFVQIVGMADVVARHRPFTANCTDSAHDTPPLHVSECLI